MLGSIESKHFDSNPTDYNTAVIASTDIPENAIAGPYPGDFRFGQNATDDPKIDFIIEVKHKDGRITLDFESSNQWTRYVQPARDRHEQNVEFYKDRTGTIFLRTTRKLKMGEQLYAWYSEPFARMSGVPFLSLQNIIDNQQYQCDKCQLSFRYPNPLKAHMMYNCKTQETNMFRPYSSSYGHYMTSPYVTPCANYAVSHMTPLLSKIDNAKKFRYSQSQPSPACVSDLDRYNTKSMMSPKTSTVPSSSSMKLNLSHDQQISPPYPIQIFNQIKTPFFPLQHSRYGCSKLFYDLIPENSRYLERRKEINHETFFFDKKDCHVKIKTRNEMAIPIPSEVEGEPLDILPKALLTKCKSGHICIFCGKFYSRKYGLKIHLRTHTGYKPLKCKVCLRPFGDPSNLNKHVRLHAEGETPYRCQFCNKVLVRRRDLERHIRSRHPQETSVIENNGEFRKEETDEDDEIIVT